MENVDFFATVRLCLSIGFTLAACSEFQPTIKKYEDQSFIFYFVADKNLAAHHLSRQGRLDSVESYIRKNDLIPAECGTKLRMLNVWDTEGVTSAASFVCE